MKSNILSLIIIVLIVKNGFAQPYDRRYNPNYMWTSFEDNFSGNQLNRKLWKPTIHFKRGLGCLIDSTKTMDVFNGNLRLKMKRAPNHLDSIWKTTGWQHIYSNYVAGEVSSIRKFQYGIFECRAKFALGKGSWPAFWLIGGSGAPCPPGAHGNEIDIAELIREGAFPQLMHVIHRYYPPQNCDIPIQKNMDSKKYPLPRKKQYYTFKCIWTPQKIQYFLDDELKHEVVNNNYEWFPSLPLNLYLSQQVSESWDEYGTIRPRAPQKSHFSWVRVKEFFLAPEISCPEIITSKATAILSVDSRATEISWKLSPESYFSNTAGKGKTALIARAQGVTGRGKIIFSFKMPSGEIFTEEKEFN